MSCKTIDLEVISKGNNKYTVKMNKSVCSKINFLCTKILIAILVFSLLVGIVPVAVKLVSCKLMDCDRRHCWFWGCAKICNLEIVISVALVLSAIIVTLIFTAKALKPFAKMEFLREIINIVMCLECPKVGNSQDNASNDAKSKDNETKGGEVQDDGNAGNAPPKDSQQNAAKEDAVNEKLARDKDLIKKFCDTLVEL